MTTRGYLVVGPESTGTKATAALLRAAGCRSIAIVGGDDGPPLPLEGRPPLVRRSLPHAGEWPSVPGLLRLLSPAEPFAVVTVRDWFSVVRSQVDRALAPDAAVAHANIRRAYREIFSALAGVPYVVSSYEALVGNRAYPRRLLEALGLPPAEVDVYDANAKWYRPGPAHTGRERRLSAM